MVQKLWSESKGSSTHEHVMVSQQFTHPLVDEVVEPVQYLVDPTLLLGGEVSTNRVFLILSSEFYGLGGILISSKLPPPSSWSVSFDWDSLVEPRLPSIAPFQIRVKFNSKNFYRFEVDKGSFTSIISSSTWKSLGSPKLLAIDSQL